MEKSTYECDCQCSHEGFCSDSRVARPSNKIVSRLEDLLKNNSDYNKGVQDSINVVSKYLTNK